VAVLLDDQARILSVNTGLAGSSFLGLAEMKRSDLHEQLHPGCDGECQFRRLWKTAWRGLTSNDSVEWEIDDPVLEKLLRMNLARPPSAKDVENDRRQAYALLTITDITRHRREYESLIRREQTLTKLLRDKGLDLSGQSEDELAALVDSADLELAGKDRRFRVLNQQAVMAQELERRRIASELHDSLAQSAGVIKYNIEGAVEHISRLQPQLDLSMLDAAVDQIRALVDEIRRISNNLTPSTLEDFGLCAALRDLCDQFRAPGMALQPSCDTCVDESYLPDAIRFTVYRVAQEALNNIAKHSAATEARVDLGIVSAELQLSIRDNGDGFDLAGIRDDSGGHLRGSGLRNMQERVIASGGKLSIESAPGEGVSILAVWPESSLEPID
jgi:signal transduction histidine kinase